ncbi:hypothetical protein [Streptomyces albipurpureus]|uniref:Uncharacterized protein n=1 Tax=Streptomyces albipurpureus TaxID=2897419 RepID=A0ABT0UUT5_9ACTN|nr:hypothetical protein [Streptomyces sp. CWNU-1]MCM2391734.1 hypothetical protein [Streptomyces sp. CWNU-1]
MNRHIGRSWGGPGDCEALCPCPKAPCGLVDFDNVDEECEQHPPFRCKTIRTGHLPEDCPGVGRDVVVAMKRTIEARRAVVAAADEWDGVCFSFELDDAIDEYRATVEHEAAERIRTLDRRKVDRFADAWEEGVEHAAELIDPDVEYPEDDEEGW